MSGPCRDLIVLDFTWGMAGGLAAMVLSDFGARVIKIEPPSGDPFRRHPAWLMWNRGKEGVVLDLKSAAGRDHALALAQRADVVLEAFRPGVAGRLGIGYEALSSANPRLVYCSLSPFGQHGPLSRVKGYEGIIAAKTGRMMAFRGQPDRDGPVFTAVPTATWGASQAAVQGIMAALLMRETTGRGQWVQTSILQGMMPYDLQSLVIHGLRAKDPVKYAVDPQTDPKRVASLQYLPARCGDGRWIQFGNNNFRLFQSTMRALGLWSIYRDERFKNAPDLTPENRELLRDMILDKLEERSLDEWMQVFIEDGDVAAEPFMTCMEGLRHPQFVHNGHLAVIDDPRTGLMDQVGLLVDLDQTPGEVKGPAPDLSQHTEAVLDWVRSAAPAGPTAKPAAAPPRYPLEGVRVLEFATIIAAPYAAALLADLGARVIKVEPPEADLRRVLAGGLGTGTVKTTAGAESIQIDLKTEDGKGIARRLIAQSDIVLHNFRIGVPERLGIDYEAVKAIRPDAIYVTVTGYGTSGPFCHRPAFHPLPGALQGGALRQAGRGVPPPP
ncbi:MAG: CoA transferase, partial [Chloroflexota bacterium]